jgi:hypothetical protein
MWIGAKESLKHQAKKEDPQTGKNESESVHGSGAKKEPTGRIFLLHIRKSILIHCFKLDKVKNTQIVLTEYRISNFINNDEVAYKVPYSI